MTVNLPLHSAGDFPVAFHRNVSFYRRGLISVVAVALLFLATSAPAIVPWTLLINGSNVVNVTTFGAAGDGTNDNTAAIQAAINSAATTNGGCTVEIPPGTNAYLCGPITLKSAVNLQIDGGAILRMLPFSRYPGSTNTGTTFISGSSLHDIEISGGGAIDGQGAAWWPYANTNGALRPRMFSPSGCTRVLVRDITLSNSPMFHIAISGGGNITVSNVTVQAPGNSPNTDACDVSGTNILVQQCTISVGDDDYTCGGGTHDVLLTNNTYGTGHGVSIGSYTSPGVSNFLVINCSFTGTDNGIRLKSERGRGGLIQNLTYCNLTMTNVSWPFLIYSYYEFGLGTITPATSAYAAGVAATDTNNVVTGTWPIWRNITFSNITAYGNNTRPALMVWGLPQMNVSNVVFQNVTLSSAKTAEIFNARGIQFIDTRLNYPAGTNGFDLFNADVIITNSAPTNTLFAFNGSMTNAYGNTNVLANSLSFFNALGTLKNTNAFDDGPLTLAASTFTVSNSLTLPPTTILNFMPGTNATMLVVKGNLVLGGTNNIFAGAGFANGTYTLMTYTGTLSGSPPTLGTVPPGHNYSINTGTAGQVNLVVTPLPAGIPTNLAAVATNLLINLKWFSSSNATSYNLKRSTINGGPYGLLANVVVTNYSDANVMPGTNYFYVVSATNAAGESANSVQVGIAPLPSNQPTNITAQITGGQLQLAWPQDHLGWRLLIQTNDLSNGLGTNWTTVPNSTNFNTFNLFASPTNGSVYLRLIYP